MGCCCCNCLYDNYITANNKYSSLRITYCRYFIVSNVIINENYGEIDKYKTQLNKFYLCNQFHTTLVLRSYIDVNPINTLQYKYKNNDIFINIRDKDIVINGRHHRLTLNDISLPDYSSEIEYLNLVN